MGNLFGDAAAVQEKAEVKEVVKKRGHQAVRDSAARRRTNRLWAQSDFEIT